MPLEIWDHFDFISKEKPIRFLWDNNENIRTESGNIEMWWWNSGYIESHTGDVEIHGYNSGWIELVSGNITIHGENNGSISTKIWNIKVWWDNNHVIETKLEDNSIFVRNNNWTIIVNTNIDIKKTYTTIVYIWWLEIKIEKGAKLSNFTKGKAKKLKEILLNKAEKEETTNSKLWTYKVIIDGYKLDFYNKKINPEYTDFYTSDDFEEDNISFDYAWQTIVVIENKVRFFSKIWKNDKEKTRIWIENNLKKFIR